MGILRMEGTEHAMGEEPRRGVGRGPRREEEEEDRAIATVIATSSSAEYIIH